MGVLICMCVSFFHSPSHAQSNKSTDTNWNSFKAAAHKIGLCIYHTDWEVCREHSAIKSELVKISDPESDVYYFPINSSWANSRLNAWAETNTSHPSNYLILFDIDQHSSKKLSDSTQTSNSYGMFSILDLKQVYQFKERQQSETQLTFYISTIRENSILTNTMWREFMTHRLGRLDDKINISLSGINALYDYQHFKAAFIRFIEK